MSETIFRIQKNADNPFVMIDKRIFTDKKLSYRAKGVLGYLLSRPDDWVVNMVDVANQSTEGRDAVITAVNELMKHGYVERIEHRENGRFKSYEYLVYEVPKPVVPSDDTAHWKTVNGKSVNGLSGNGKSATTNKDNTKKENTNTLNVPFDDFWNLYDKKVGDKEKIKTKWEKLKDSEREAIMNHLPLYKKSQQNKKYRKDPATYLNNKSWNDEIIFDDGQQPVVAQTYSEQAAAPVFDEVVLKTDPKVLAMIAAKRKGGSHGTA